MGDLVVLVVAADVEGLALDGVQGASRQVRMAWAASSTWMKGHHFGQSKNPLRKVVSILQRDEKLVKHA